MGLSPTPASAAAAAAAAAPPPRRNTSASSLEEALLPSFELGEAGDAPDPGTLRGKVFEVTHSWRAQVFLLLLLVLDVLLVIADLAMDTEFPDCDRALAVCGLPPDADCASPPRAVEVTREIIDGFSDGILLLFVIEILASTFAVGPVKYCTQPLLVFDAFVVFGSVALEMVVGRKRHHDTGLLVMARAWRFLSLFHSLRGVRETTDEVRSALSLQASQSVGGAHSQSRSSLQDGDDADADAENNA